MRGSFLNKNRILAIAFGVLTVVSIFANPGKWASEPARAPFVESEPSRSPASLIKPDITRTFVDAPKKLPSFLKEDERRSAQFQNIAPVSADSGFVEQPSSATLEAPFSSPVYQAPGSGSDSRFYSGNYAGANSVNTGSLDTAKKTSGTSSSSIDSSNSNNTYNPSVTADGALPISSPTNTIGSTTNRSTASSPPGAPSSLIANGAPGSVVLTWGAVSGATMYTIERSLTLGGAFTTIATGILSAGYSDFAVTNNVTYYYRVTALNSGGGAVSDIVSAIPSDLPTQPTLLLVASNGSASLTWTTSTGNGTITYSVERSLTLGSGYAVVQSGLSSTSFTDSSLTDGTLYYYRVQAHNLAGDSTYSSEVSAKSIHSFLAGTATAGEKSAVITWALATGASTYAVQYGTTSGTYTTTLTGQSSPTTITGLTGGTPYFFSVKATNSDHGLTLSTNELTATPLGTFSITALTPVDIGKLKITWGASTGATSYDIGCSTTSGTYTTLTFTNQTSPATLSGFSDATPYYCMVIAKNATGQANASAEASTTTYSLFTYTWPFDAGTDSSYSFDASKLELVGGVSRLKNMTPTDASATGGDFKEALFSGVKWDSLNSKITLNSLTDDGEMNPSWSPQYNKLVAYWKLNGSAGSTIPQGAVLPATVGPDVVAQNPDATGLTYVASNHQQGVYFDGVNDALQSSSSQPISLTNQYSFSLWFYKTGSWENNYQKLFVLGTSSTNIGIYLSQGPTSDGYFYLGTKTLSDDQYIALGHYPSLDQWHQAAGTYDGSVLKFYIDGALVGTKALSGNLAASSPARLGWGYNLEYFKGSLDEAGLWNTPLSATEIKTLYERQRSRYSGTLLSRVMTSGPITSWSGLNYTTALPYGKELPSNGASENREDYPLLETAAPNGAIAFWKLDEGSIGTAPGGTDFLDSSNQGNNGTKIGNFDYNTSGKIKTAQNFNGIDQSIDIGTFNTLAGSATMSASAWIKQNSSSMAGLQEVMRKENQIAFQLLNGTVNFYVGTTTWRSSGWSPAIITDDKWHFLTGTYNGTTVKIYVDGVLQNSVTYASETLASNANHLYIGSMFNGSEYFNGALDEVAIYNRTLSQSDVTGLYHQNSSLMAGNTGLWHLNETSGTTASDSSGNAANGTIDATVTLGEDGKFGKGAFFDGTNHIDLPSTSVAYNSFTMSAWFKTTANADQKILALRNLASPLQTYFGKARMCFGACAVGTTAINDGLWHHIASVGDKNSITLYVDGHIDGTLPASATVTTGPMQIGSGCTDGTCGALTLSFVGGIDEVASWSRPLSVDEIAQLYQRGVNRVLLQARTCSSSDCSDDPAGLNWNGSAPNPNAYLSELNNSTVNAPQFLFSNFGVSLTNQPYFQYRALLESDTSNVLPDIRSVSAGPARFDATLPKIIPIDGPKFQIYTGFTTTLGASCVGTPKFELSHDKQTWYYYTGGSWTSSDGTASQSSDSATINSHIATFGATAGPGALYAKVFYPSDTSTPCEIDQIAVSGADSSSTHSINPGSFLVTSVFSSNGQATLIWGSSSSATGYTVCYGTTQALADACGTSVTSASTSKTVTGLTNNTPYYFTVYANNASGTTTASTPVSAMPMAPPTTPSSLVASAGLFSAQLSWTGSTGSGNITYNVMRSQTSGSGYSTIASGVTSTAFTDLAALANTQYYYVVTASNGGGTSAKSNEASAKPIGSFSITSAVGTDTTAVLAWSAASGAASYDVKYGTSSASYSTTLTNQTSPVTLTGLTNNTTYYVLITANNSSGSANNSAETQVKPVGSFTTTAANAIAQVTLTPTAATGASTYNLRYGTTSGTYTTTIINQAFPYTVTGLTGGTTYYFVIDAVNTQNGLYTSAEVSATAMSAVNYTWTFDQGTDTAYSFDSTKVELVGGVCRLKNAAPTDSSYVINDFKAGTLSGLTWDSGNSKITLDPNTDDGELNSNWTPKYNQVVGYYKFNGTVNASIGQGTIIPATIGVDAVAQNAASTGMQYTSGQQKQGIHFDGVDDAIFATNFPALDKTDGNAITISAWIKPHWTGGYQTLVTNRLDAGHFNWIFYQHTNAGELSFHGLSQYKSTYIPPNDVWTHVVATVSSAGVSKIYANGVEVYSGTYQYSTTTPGALGMGSWRSSTEAYYNGDMDEVAIWNANLSAAEIKTIYERQHARYTGTILSRVMSSGTTTPWSGLSYLTKLPYGKEIQGSIAENPASYTGLASISNNSLTTGMLGFWHMDETAAASAPGGKDFTDASGNGNHASIDTPANFTFGQSAKLGKSLGINTGSVTVPVQAGSFSSGVATISLWLYWDGTDGVMPIGFANYDLYFHNGNLGFNTANSDVYGVSNPVTANTWTHIVAEFHASDVTLNKLYVNGSPLTLTLREGTLFPANAIVNVSSFLLSGWGRNGNYHLNNCKMDEVGTWNRALTQAEVTQLYAMKEDAVTNLAGLWHFNETAGTSGAGSVIDATNFAHNGTPTNVTFGGQGKFKTAANFNGTSSYVSLGNDLFNTQTKGSISTWVYFTTPPAAGTYGNIFSAASATSFTNLFLMHLAGISATDTRIQIGQRSTNNQLYGNTSLAPNQWHHVVWTSDSATWKLYVDGIPQTLTASTGVNSGAWFANETSGTMQYSVGVLQRFGGNQAYLNGSVDELAVWNRPLSSTEVQQLYQRGANRVLMQARSCSSSDCSDDPSDANWRGLSSSSNSYLSEINSSTYTSPNFTFSNFGYSLSNNPYFQYRAILESDDASVSPDLTSVTGGGNRFDATQPTIIPVNGPKYQILTSFSAILGANGCLSTPKYQLSPDKSTWYYYSGGWITAGASADISKANIASDINTNIGTFTAAAGTGTLYVRAFLPSNSLSACEIDSIAVGGGHTNPATSSNPSAFLITSAAGNDGTVNLSWNAASSATGYTICYGTSQALADACGTSVTTAGTSTSIGSLTNNTQYYFTVVATDSSGRTPASISTSTTPMAAPTTPTALAAVGGNYHVNLSWSASTGTGPITYSVKRGTVSSGPYTTIAPSVTTTSYTDLTALAGTAYYYVVTASNTGGTSANSNEVTTGSIGDFAITSIVGSSGKITLFWGTAVGATSYDVKYGTATASYSTTSSNQTSGAAYTGFTDGTQYYFIVVAKNNTGSSTNTIEAPVIPVQSYTLTATAGLNSVSIGFSNTAAGATSSKIEYGTSPGVYGTTVNGPANPQVITGLVSGTTYYFRSTAWNAVNGTYTTAEVSAKPFQAFSYDWGYDPGTSSSYNFSNSLIEVTGGVCRLANLTPYDYDNSASGWGSATLKGVKWDSTQKALVLDSTSSDATLLVSSWTPQFANLIGYWNFSGTNGATIADSTSVSGGTAHNANATGMNYVTGPTQNISGITFDGVDDYVVNASQALDVTGDVTTQMWIRTAASGNTTVPFSKYDSAGDHGWEVVINPAGKIQFSGRSGVGAFESSGNSITSINNNQWHYIVGVRSGAVFKIYVDGKLEASATQNAGSFSNTVSTYIANQDAGAPYFFGGSIANVGLWNVALSDTEIKTIFERQSARYTGTVLSRVMDAGASTSWLGLNWFSSLPFGKELTPNLKGDSLNDYSGLPPNTNGLIGHWKMNETAAGSAPGGKDILDDSGNSNHGVASGTLEYGDQGKVGTSIKMNKNQIAVTLPAGTLTSGNIATTSFWMYWNGSDTQMPVGFNTYDLWAYGGNIGFNTGNSDQWGINGASIMNRWTHVVAEFHTGDTHASKLWIDGVLQTLSARQPTPQISANAVMYDTFYIGGWAANNGHRFNNRLDDVSLWNRVLTQDEITQLAAGTNNLMAGNVGLWHFDEATTGTAPGGADFKDDSGKGNHCTAATGPAPGAAGKISLAAKNAVGGFINCGTDSSTSVTTAMSYSGWYWFNALTAQDNIIFNREGSYELGARGTFQYALQTNTSGLWYWVDTGIPVPTQQWVHVGFSYDSTLASNQVKFYLNGVLAYQGTYTGTITPSADPFEIGSRSSGGGGFDGYIDEAALWNRAITSSEMSQLYRRGANRINFQVRSCTASDCSDDPSGANWKGWNGANTYFNETMNTTSSVVNSSGPHLLFSDYALGSISSSQYFQYRAVFASDDTSTSPDLARVEAGPARYTITAPSIYTLNGPTYLSLTGISLTYGDQGCSGGTPRFQFSTDKVTWFYYNGTGWAATTLGYIQANDIATVNAQFPSVVMSGTIYMKAYLPSSGTTPCEIDKVNLTGTQY